MKHCRIFFQWSSCLWSWVFLYLQPSNLQPAHLLCRRGRSLSCQQNCTFCSLEGIFGWQNHSSPAARSLSQIKVTSWHLFFCHIAVGFKWEYRGSGKLGLPVLICTCYSLLIHEHSWASQPLVFRMLQSDKQSIKVQSQANCKGCTKSQWQR